MPDKNKIYFARRLPTVTVAAKKIKYNAGYDDNGNPIYTNDYTKSNEYANRIIPEGDIEKRRKQWYNENVSSNGIVKPGLKGYASDVARVAEYGIGGPIILMAGAAPLLESAGGISMAGLKPGGAFWANPITKGMITGKTVSTGVDIASKSITGNTWSDNAANAIKFTTGWNPRNSAWASWIPDATNPGWWLNPNRSINLINNGVDKISVPINNLIEKYPILEQYPRYIAGKFKYGFDAKLPNLYRKVKALPIIKNNKIQISNPNNRFAFDNGLGEESPLITNMTSDAPVRRHDYGDWDRALTLNFPGKSLLGRHVISTRPSDTFTYGDDIWLPIKKVTGITGRKKEINFLNNNKIKSITSDNAKKYWSEESNDLINKINKTRFDRYKQRNNGIRIVKNPVDNFDNYSKEIERLTRDNFIYPRIKDYKFMDYVFKPRYQSEVIPKLNITEDNLMNTPLGDWYSNSALRHYYNDNSRFKNVMYNAATPVESTFRTLLNIGLKDK